VVFIAAKHVKIIPLDRLKIKNICKVAIKNHLEYGSGEIQCELSNFFVLFDNE
jgi:hypothetical protein